MKISKIAFAKPTWRGQRGNGIAVGELSGYQLYWPLVDRTQAVLVDQGQWDLQGSARLDAQLTNCTLALPQDVFFGEARCRDLLPRALDLHAHTVAQQQ